MDTKIKCRSIMGLCIALIIAIVAIGYVSANDRLVVYATQAITVVVNGQRVQFTGQQPTIVNGRTLVPVRGVFDQLGFIVGWDGPTQRVTLTSDTHTVILTVGSASFTTNGTAHTLDVPAQIIGGSTMIPLRAVVESVGLDLNWEGSTSTITISGSTSSTIPANLLSKKYQTTL